MIDFHKYQNGISMNNKSLVIRISFLVSFLLISSFLPQGLLLPQEKPGTKNYNPVEGQEGKDVRWFPTPQELVDRMLDMAKVTPADFLVDLGSGDGRTVITAARRGVHAVGVEYNGDLVELAKRNAAKSGVAGKAEFIKADLFEYDLSKATVVTLFLLPEINLKLRPRLLNLKPGTRIVSTTFTMQNWQYDDMVKINDKTTQWLTAYLWIVPAKVQGTWKFSDGELKLTQQFQMISGEMTRNGKSVRISSGRIRGNDVTFSADGSAYSCVTDGTTMKGTVKATGTETDWSARKLK